MGAYDFGYPEECARCSSFSNQCLRLQAQPYLKYGHGNLKVMLIGQDPTIYRNPERVQFVLMLNEERGQLKRWLIDLFSENHYEAITLYATNLVKCSFEKAPYSSLLGTISFLRPYFEQCKGYLIQEVNNFQPQLALTLGEPAHRLFTTILDNEEDFNLPMKKVFTGEFKVALLDRVKFFYSPCLHIKTFRVAETYGNKVIQFKTSLIKFLSQRQLA